MTTARTQSFDRKLAKNVFRIGQYLVTGLIAGVAYLNIQPYLQLMLWLAPDTNSATINFLLGVPVIGWLISSAGWLIAILGAVIVWGTVQVIEILADLLKNDRDNLKYTVNTYRQSAGNQLSASETDPTVIQRLVNFYNNLPTRWVKALFTAQKVAFVIDASLAVICYPPIYTDWQSFVGAPSVQDVNWINVGIIIACVFFANMMLWLITTIQQGSQYFKQEVGNV